MVTVISASAPPKFASAGIPNVKTDMKTEVKVRGFFYFFSSFFRGTKRTSTMEVEDGHDGASAGRGEGGADAPAAHARPSEHAAAPVYRNCQRP